MKMNKKEKQLLIIAGVVGGIILLLLWVTSQGGGSSSSGKTGTGVSGNGLTASEFSSSWNMSSTWSGPSGQHGTRHGVPPTSTKPPVTWDKDHDKIVSGSGNKK